MKRPLSVLLPVFWLCAWLAVCSPGLVNAQEAVPQSPAAPVKQPTEMETRAQFAAADAQRVAAKEGSLERADAATKAAQLASRLAWQLFYVDKTSEASRWFAQYAALDQEAYKISRVALLAGFGGLESTIKTRQAHLSTVTTEEERMKLRRTIYAFRSLQLASYLYPLSLLANRHQDHDLLLQVDQQVVAVYRLQVSELPQVPDPILDPNLIRANLAGALETLASAQSGLKRFDEAENTCKEALVLRRQLATGGYAEADVDVSLCAQGDLLQERGGFGARKKYDEALKALEESKPLLEKTLAGPMPLKYSGSEFPRENADKYWAADKSRMYWGYIQRYAEIMKDLGSAAGDRGDWKAELQFVTQGVTCINEAISKIDFGKASKTEDPDLTFGGLVFIYRLDLLDEIANIHAFCGDTGQAMKEHLFLLDQRRTLLDTLGKGSVSSVVTTGKMAMNLLMIARLLLEQDDIDALEHAITYAEQARRIDLSSNALLGVLNADAVLTSLSCELHRLHRERHEDKQAVTALEAADHHAQDANSEAHLLAIQEPNVAVVALSRRLKARVLVLEHQPQKALALLDGIEKLDVHMSLNAQLSVSDLRGEAHEMQNDLQDARRDYRQALQYLEQQRALSPAERGFVDLKENARLYDRAVRLCIRLGLANQAFDYLIKARSSKVQDLLRTTPVRTEKQSAPGQPARTGQQSELRNLVDRVKRQEDEIDDIEARLRIERNPQTIKRLEHAKDAAQNRYADLIKKMKADSRDDRDHLLNLYPTLKAFDSRNIPEDMLLVEFVPADNLYVFLLSREGLRMRVLPKADPAQVKQIAGTLNKKISESEQKLNHTTQNLAVKNEVDQEQQNENWKDELTKLYDLLLRPIDLELKTKRVIGFIPDQYFHYIPMHALAYEQNHKLRFFIQDRQVFYLPANDLRVITNARNTVQLGTGIMGCYSRDLPQAQAEVEAITSLFAPAKILSGKSLTVSAITEAGINRRYWHFALHMHLEQQNPKASFLEFDNGADGKWTLEDLMEEFKENSGKSRLKRVDLVTLSTCQSALGEADPDGTDIMSLAGAFTNAGVDSVVATLWKVDDDSTKEFMVDFYTQLARGNSKAAALRHAQLTMISSLKYNHPVYWAPFLLMGDWR